MWSLNAINPTFKNHWWFENSDEFWPVRLIPHGLEGPGSGNQRRSRRRNRWIIQNHFGSKIETKNFWKIYNLPKWYCINTDLKNRSRLGSWSGRGERVGENVSLVEPNSFPKIDSAQVAEKLVQGLLKIPNQYLKYPINIKCDDYFMLCWFII